MTGEEMERAIEFLLDHHAKVSADIERHSEQIGQLTVAVSALNDSMKVMQQEMKANRAEIRAALNVTQQEMKANRVEIREALDNLIIANEATRNLAEQAARLAIQTSQRVTNLETR